ncbi:transforming growth factor beta regulator 1-like [Drosophila elegans]|uniref:transforming growth factor beta regulator 1-like n=1 Tax=Drosophila elegans TaxID=30023 RepID=UPI0007E64938|nr:transforming growth factor beta regulator 1-like [Drosophila elegans]
MNLKYKRRYESLKRSVKSYLLENASLTDEICRLQAELSVTRSQRLYLIERLMFHEGLEKSNNGRPSVSNGKVESSETSFGGVRKSKPVVLHKKPGEDKPKNVTIIRKKKPMFPMNLNNVLLHSLGEIVSVNSNFHTESWIYPVGYVATRIYAHPKDPRKKCVFTCKILNNAGIPQFQIIPDNDLDGVFFGESANTCHLDLLNSIQRSPSVKLKIPFDVQGEVFFGLSNQKTQSLLMMDPGFHQCTNFKGFAVQNIQSLNSASLSFETLQGFLS